MSEKKHTKAKSASGAHRGASGRNASWQRGREGHPRTLALIALVGAAAILAGYFLQNSALLRSDASADVRDAVRLSEVMAENLTTLITEAGEVPDWIEIENAGDTEVDLHGYSLLLGSNVNKMFTFPAQKLAPGGFVLVYADKLASAGVAGALSAPFKLAASGGDSVVLLNAAGGVADTLTTPELGADVSYARAQDGSWAVSYAPTPGAANRIEDEQSAAAAAQVTVVEDALELSEVMTSNTLYFADESGAYSDYVEIHNRTDAAVSLNGWYLSDSSDKLKRWAFPEVTLPAGGYLAVHCSGADRKTDGANLHTNFKLSRDGESVYLSRPDGQTVSAVDVPALECDQAYSYFDGAWGTALAPTPNLENSYDAAARVNAQRFSGAAGGVYISEVMASPSKQDYDWVELYNASSGAIDLSNYGLSDDPSKPRQWQFPQGTTIQPGEYMGVYLSGTQAATLGNLPNASFALAAEGGYTLCLSDPAGNVLDALYLAQQYGGISYGRAGAQGGGYYFAEGTPGVANSVGAYRARAAVAQYSVRGGMFDAGERLSVELSAAPGSQIYYTLDCSDPDNTATPYSGPIEISDTTILRTRVYRDGYMESYMDTQSYLYGVNNGGNAYVVSLVSDDDNLFSDERGIMVKGPNATEKSPYGSMNHGANFWMDWEREAHVEVYTADGAQAVSQECGIKLHGQYSRAADVKPFKVYARSEYGDNRFRYPLFSNRDYQEYQSFLLRASGQDYNRTFMRDSVMATLARGTSVMYQESELCVCYLNGRYYAMMYLRERVSTYMICQYEGWVGQEDDIDLIKANSREMQGSNETFAALIDWLDTHDANTDEAYNRIDSAIDLQNYIEYMAIQIFLGNGDTLNVKRYRNPNTDGKWRWALFDLDWSFTTDTNSISRWVDPSGMGTGKRTDTTLFIACMKNDVIRDRFLTYFGQQLATSFSTENITSMIEARYELYKDLLPEYLQRLGMSEESYKKQLKRLVQYGQTRPTKLLGYFDGVFHFTDEQKQRYFGAAIEKINQQSAS